MTTNLYPGRKIRICYLNSEPRLVDNKKLHIEEKLKQIGDVELVSIKSIDATNFHPCDLLIMTADLIPEEEFYNWILNFSKRIHKQAGIMIPTVVISDVSFLTQKHFLVEAFKSNWYFDVISDQHLTSLPIRITNLLRIHDHLHEISRYQTTLTELQVKVDKLTESYEALNQRQT